MLFDDILLTVDYDRTLTAPDSTIPQRNLEAIRYFMENGGHFTVNTGRSLPMTNCFRDIVPVNAPLLLYNGSAAYDMVSGELINCKPLEIDPQTLVRALETRFPGLVLEQQGTYANHLFHKDALWESYCENNKCPWEYADFDHIPQPFLKLALYAPFRDNTVASTYAITDQDRMWFDEAIAYINETYGDKIDLFRACAGILDIHAKGVSKLRSARNLQKQLGKKILVCVGDAENDMNMLDGADYAYCPADGVVADRYENVCNCGDGAVADVIYYKLPEILKTCDS